MFLSVPPCQALSWHWAFLSHSINQRRDAAALTVLLQPREQDDSSMITPSTEWPGGRAAIASVITAPPPISSKHVSCQGAGGLYLGWQERREIGGKVYLRLCSEQSVPSFTSAAERSCLCVSTLLVVQGEHEINACQVLLPEWNLCATVRVFLILRGLVLVLLRE